MLKHTKRALVLIVGVFFVLFGIIGLFLPFLQGILFLVIGALLLSAAALQKLKRKTGYGLRPWRKRRRRGILQPLIVPGCNRYA